MKKNHGFRLPLRVAAFLAAVCLLPSAAFGLAVVEDIDLNDPADYLLPLDFSVPPAPKAECFSESKDEKGNLVYSKYNPGQERTLSDIIYFATLVK